MLLNYPPTEYLLELRNATKLSTGVYEWAFTERNYVRPKSVRIGPCSVTSDTHLRNVVLLTDSFRESSSPFVLRSDELKRVLCVVHPEKLTKPPVETVPGQAQQSTQPGTDTSMEALTNLLAWIDLAPSRTFDNTFTSSTVGGPLVHYMYNRAAANSYLTMVTQYGSGLTLSNLGTSGKAITRTGSWESSADSTPIHYTDLTEEFSAHSIIRLTDTSWTYIWDLYLNKTLMWGNPATLSYINASDQKVAVPGIVMIPNTNYLLSVARVANSGAYDFQYRVENLDDSSAAVQTATVAGAGLPMQANPQTWRFGHSSTHFKHYMGPFCFLKNNVQSEQENVRSWLRNHMGSTNTETSESESTATNQWYQLYDTRITTINMEPSRASKVQKSLQISFEDHHGNLFDPRDVILHMSIEKN